MFDLIAGGFGVVPRKVAGIHGLLDTGSFWEGQGVWSVMIGLCYGRIQKRTPRGMVERGVSHRSIAGSKEAMGFAKLTHRMSCFRSTLCLRRPLKLSFAAERQAGNTHHFPHKTSQPFRWR